MNVEMFFSIRSFTIVLLLYLPDHPLYVCLYMYIHIQINLNYNLLITL